MSLARGAQLAPSSHRNRLVIHVFSAEAVLAAVSPSEANGLVREAFERHARGEWEMPAKVYIDAGPEAVAASGAPGDFRAMPARGDGVAILKWVTSFPGNSSRGLPVVTGALLVSDAATGALAAVMDTATVTSLRTGAAAAVSAQALAPAGARTVGLIGCGVNGAFAARSLAAAGYGEGGGGVCFDVRTESAEALAGELGWVTGSREEAASQDVVVTVTPGDAPVIGPSDLRPGQHLAVLGADAHGKAEVERAALASCRLFCDEWRQASAGGELSGAAADGEIGAEDVTEIGAVLTGSAPGRSDAGEITLFDSTGLAIQDLAIARAVLAAHRAGRVRAQDVAL
jgi:alanine dehydrogenase